MNKQQRLVLTISILASFVAGLDGFIVNVALPTIGREFGGGLAVQQWVVDAYLITLGALILIAGSLSDTLGRKRILMLGLTGFGLASLLCAVAPDSTFLIVCRAAQGVAGALLVPSSLALIVSNFSGKAQGRAIGIWTACFSISSIIGPPLGGLIIALTSWRWIFVINLLPVAVCLRLLAGLDQPRQESEGRAIDFLGALLCVLGLGGPVFSLIEEPYHSWSSPLIWLPLAVGIVLFACFILHEKRSPSPMLPLSLFKIRNFSFGNLATLAIYAGLGVSNVLITLVLQEVCHYSALKAGLALLPVSVVMFLLSSRFGALAGRFGPRIFMGAGPIIAGFGFLLMTRTQAHVQYASQLLPGVLVFALGLATTVAPLTAAVLGDIAARNAGVASAVNNAVARIAGLVSVACLGVLIGSHLTIAGFHHGVTDVALLMFAGGIISIIGIRSHAA